MIERIEYYADLIWRLPLIIYFVIGFMAAMGAFCAYGIAMCARLLYYYLDDQLYWKRRHWREARNQFRRKRGW